jgi:hypothetical protein
MIELRFVPKWKGETIVLICKERKKGRRRRGE